MVTNEAPAPRVAARRLRRRRAGDRPTRRARAATGSSTIGTPTGRSPRPIRTPATWTPSGTSRPTQTNIRASARTSRPRCARQSCIRKAVPRRSRSVTDLPRTTCWCRALSRRRKRRLMTRHPRRRPRHRIRRRPARPPTRRLRRRAAAPRCRCSLWVGLRWRSSRPVRSARASSAPGHGAAKRRLSLARSAGR